MTYNEAFARCRTLFPGESFSITFNGWWHNDHKGGHPSSYWSFFRNRNRDTLPADTLPALMAEVERYARGETRPLPDFIGDASAALGAVNLTGAEGEQD